MCEGVLSGGGMREEGGRRWRVCGRLSLFLPSSQPELMKGVRQAGSGSLIHSWL